MRAFGPVTAGLNANTARSPLVPMRKSTGATVAALTWLRIFSSVEVVLSVVNTVAATARLR